MPRRYPPRSVVRSSSSLALERRSPSSRDVRDERSHDLQLAQAGADRSRRDRRPRAPTRRSSSPPPSAGSASSRPSWRSRARSTRSSSSRTWPQKALPGDRVSDRAGNQRQPRLPRARRLAVGLLRLEAAGRPRRGRCGGSGWPARSPTSTRPPAGTYGALRVTAELRYGREIVVGHNAVAAIMRELGIKGLPTRRLPQGRPRRRRSRSLDLVAPRVRSRRARRAVDDRHHRAPHPRGQDLLLRRARRVLAPGRRLVDRQHPDHGARDQRARHGDPPARPAGGLVIHSDRGVQFTSWAFSQNVRDAGLAPSMGAVGSPYDNAMVEVVLGPHAGRAAQPPDLEDPHRARHRDPRLHRALPQHPPPHTALWHAHPDRVRRPTHHDHDAA